MDFLPELDICVPKSSDLLIFWIRKTSPDFQLSDGGQQNNRRLLTNLVSVEKRDSKKEKLVALPNESGFCPMLCGLECGEKEREKLKFSDNGMEILSCLGSNLHFNGIIWLIRNTVF